MEPSTNQVHQVRLLRMQVHRNNCKILVAIVDLLALKTKIILVRRSAQPHRMHQATMRRQQQQTQVAQVQR